MGFLSDIKKLLFGVKSVTKSAADKAVDAGKSLGEDLVDKSGDLLDSVKDKAENMGDSLVDKASDIGEKVMDKAEDIWDKAVDSVEDIGDRIEKSEVVQKAKDVAVDIGEKVKSAGEKIGDQIEKSNVIDKAKDFVGDIGDKAKDVSSSIGDKIADVTDRSSAVSSDSPTGSDKNFVEKVGEEVVEKSDKAWEKIEDAATNIGGKILDAKADLVDKAASAIGNLDDTLDEVSAKAEQMKAEEAAEPEYKDMPDQLSKSEMEGKDDFFSKAEAFADGRYSEVRDPEPQISEAEPAEVVDDTPSAADPLPGFEDRDGDGSEIVDDAEIISEEE